MVLNKNLHRDGKICARRCHGVPVPFSVWKELSQLQGSLPRCSAPLDRGNKARGGLIRIWLLGTGPEKTLSSLPFSTTLLSSPLFFLSSCSLPLDSGTAEKPSRPSCAGICMLLGGTDRFQAWRLYRGREQTGHANSHTKTRRCRRPKIIHKETREKMCGYFVFPLCCSF